MGNKPKLKHKKRRANKAVNYLYRELVRNDANFFNKVMYWSIIMVFVCQYIMLVATAVVGYERIGFFGPVSNTLGLGTTKAGLFIELSFTVIITVIFVSMMKEKVRYNMYK